MREMIQTERDYVKSLEYVIENYVPMLLNEDIPQALRGQRNVIFGNIEKIYEFHSQHFLKELERHENCPLQVGESFLKHVSTLYIYYTEIILSEFDTVTTLYASIAILIAICIFFSKKINDF
jgi:pleckstrin homology domain-containing family G member 4